MQPQGGTNKNKTMQLNGMRIFHCARHDITDAGMFTINIDGVEKTDLAFAIQISEDGPGVVTCGAYSNRVEMTFSNGNGSGTDISLLVLRP